MTSLPTHFPCPSTVASIAARMSAGADWAIEQGEAITLQPNRLPRALRVTGGALWVTGDGNGASGGWGGALGDRFVLAGETLEIPAGQRVVVEPVRRGRAEAARFALVELPTLSVRRAANSWHDLVASPFSDLRVAAHGAARALLRLAIGVVQFGLYGAGIRLRQRGATEAGAPCVKEGGCVGV